MKLKVGDTVKWMRPLDHDWLYGIIISITDKYATIKGIGLYSYLTVEVHFSHIEKITGGKGNGANKKYNKSFPAKC